MTVKCPRCNNEFADGLQNCPYCGCEVAQKDSVNGEFSVPKFTGSANPRVKNQKEAIKKINEVNKIPNLNMDGAGKAEPVIKKQSKETTPLKKNITDTVQTDKSTTTAAPDTASGNAPAENKPLTKEDLIAMQKKADEQRFAEQEKMEEEITHQDEGDEMIEKEAEESKEEHTEEIKSSKRRLFGRKKRIKEKSTEVEPFTEESPELLEDNLEEEEDKYDVNIDGYYDDLIPELAHQINKIPQENIIKVVFIVIFIIILCFIILYTSQ